MTAFVGRALRGPVNRPVRVRSFAEYQQVFGGLWQPSTLSYAVEQFFENGGREAVIVRVVNGGAPATITLPCGGDSLMLEALSPGSREVLRASVDYDNIGPAEEDRFNLVVQRVRTLGSEHIEDQEIFRRMSIAPGSARFVATALQESMLVRVRGAVPACASRPHVPAGRAPSDRLRRFESRRRRWRAAHRLRPHRLGRTAARASSRCAASRTCISSAFRRRRAIATSGPSVLLVAAQFCRDRRAMLIVDPPAAWDTCDEALHGLRELVVQQRPCA